MDPAFLLPSVTQLNGRVTKIGRNAGSLELFNLFLAFSKLPVLTAYFPVLAYGILGKGGLSWQNHSSVADCQALTEPVCM